MDTNQANYGEGPPKEVPKVSEQNPQKNQKKDQENQKKEENVNPTGNRDQNPASPIQPVAQDPGKEAQNPPTASFTFTHSPPENFQNPVGAAQNQSYVSKAVKGNETKSPSKPKPISINEKVEEAFRKATYLTPYASNVYKIINLMGNEIVKGIEPEKILSAFENNQKLDMLDPTFTPDFDSIPPNEKTHPMEYNQWIQNFALKMVKMYPHHSNYRENNNFLFYPMFHLENSNKWIQDPENQKKIQNFANNWIENTYFSTEDGLTFRFQQQMMQKYERLIIVEISYPATSENFNYNALNKVMKNRRYSQIGPIINLPPDKGSYTHKFQVSLNLIDNPETAPDFVTDRTIICKVISRITKCTGCNTFGHLKQNCTLFCDECGKIGHQANKCHSSKKARDNYHASLNQNINHSNNKAKTSAPRPTKIFSNPNPAKEQIPANTNKSRSEEGFTHVSSPRKQKVKPNVTAQSASPSRPTPTVFQPNYYAALATEEPVDQDNIPTTSSSNIAEDIDMDMNMDITQEMEEIPSKEKKTYKENIEKTEQKNKKQEKNEKKTESEENPKKDSNITTTAPSVSQETSTATFKAYNKNSSTEEPFTNQDEQPTLPSAITSNTAPTTKSTSTTPTPNESNPLTNMEPIPSANTSNTAPTTKSASTTSTPNESNPLTNMEPIPSLLPQTPTNQNIRKHNNLSETPSHQIDTPTSPTKSRRKDTEHSPTHQKLIREQDENKLISSQPLLTDSDDEDFLQEHGEEPSSVQSLSQQPVLKPCTITKEQPETEQQSKVIPNTLSNNTPSSTTIDTHNGTTPTLNY